MFGNLGTTELLLILVVALIVFGPRKLPQLGRTLGQTLAQFRRASEDLKRSWEQEITIEEKRPSALSPPPVSSVSTGESVVQPQPAPAHETRNGPGAAPGGDAYG
jgi:Tat protein translocase TatB subunit